MFFISVWYSKFWLSVALFVRYILFDVLLYSYFFIDPHKPQNSARTVGGFQKWIILCCIIVRVTLFEESVVGPTGLCIIIYFTPSPLNKFLNTSPIRVSDAVKDDHTTIVPCSNGPGWCTGQEVNTFHNSSPEFHRIKTPRSRNDLLTIIVIMRTEVKGWDIII